MRRFPFGLDGVVRYRVAGEMRDDESDIEIPVGSESLTDMNRLPCCPDCLGSLSWAEVVYGIGARQCMQCGSVFVVSAE